MTPMPELRLDSLVPVPDHVVVGHVDEPVQRDAREAAFAEELLLEPVLAPHPQRTPAGVAELPDRVRSVAFVCDVQAHGLVALLPTALRHKGSSSRSGSPRKRHHLATPHLPIHPHLRVQVVHETAHTQADLDDDRNRTGILPLVHMRFRCVIVVRNR